MIRFATLRERQSVVGATVTLAAVLGGAAGCSKPAADNLLFVSFDTTRADRLSAYGYSPASR